jgi:GAF domain-containing protein
VRKIVIFRYSLYGALFGMIFPFVSSLILISENHLPFTISGFVDIHNISYLQWIIDTAPLFLGLFASFAGIRQSRVEQLNHDLLQTAHEREASIEQLQQIREGQQKEIERAVSQLRTAAQVAQEANHLRDMQQLLDDTTQLISEKFGFYHVGIFLIHESDNYAELEAANSPGGMRMLDHGHRLKVGEQGIVGYAASTGEPRIALDVGADAVYFDNPELPETRSEMALPLRISGRTIGVLDIQSTIGQAFDEHDITVLQIIADSLASSIQNTRLFNETQGNLEEIRKLNRLYLEKSWSQINTEQGPFEYTYISKDFDRRNMDDPYEEPVVRNLQLPIRIRDQVIGTIDIEADPLNESGIEDSEWLPEEINLVEAVIDQATLTLENVRLISEAQRLAKRGQITSEVTSRFRQTLDLDSVLRTAVEEIHNTLGIPEVIISLGDPNHMIQSDR